MLERKSIKLLTVELSYLEWKEGADPILLLHGLVDHALVWSNLGDYLAKDYEKRFQPERVCYEK